MTLVIGTCVKEFTSTEFGVTKSADPWTFSALTCGQHRIFFFLPLCVHS